MALVWQVKGYRRRRTGTGSCALLVLMLNVNVKEVGKMSSRTEEGLIVYTLFNKHQRKFRKCKPQRKRTKVKDSELCNEVRNGILM